MDPEDTVTTTPQGELAMVLGDSGILRVVIQGYVEIEGTWTVKADTASSGGRG